MTEYLRPNGYLVVRNQGTRYRGPDRQPWDAIDDAYWAGRLPPSIRGQYEEMRAKRGLWWPTVCSLSHAMDLANYSEGVGGGSWEVVGVHSPYLASLGMPACPDSNVFEQCGLDVVSVGEWSLLRALIEAHPEQSDIEILLNEVGLISDPDSVQSVVRKYRSFVKAGRVEDTAEPTADRGIETIVVFLRV
jgi:hypothetical protein